MTSAEKAKDKRLRATYKQTLGEHNAKRAEQLNACAICRRPFTQFQPYQDHDHLCCPRRKKEFCGKCNRALLCYLCNKWAVAAIERMRKVGIDPLAVIKYVDDWAVTIRAKGGYEQKEKSPKLRKAKVSVRPSDGSVSQDAVARFRAGLCQPQADKKSSSARPSKTLPAEFRCDVEQTVERVVAVKYHQWFWAAYGWFDSVDTIEREYFVQRLLGDRRHSWEQRLGAKFLEVGLDPPTKYFDHVRRTAR